jgi:CheY-like chemotaxis protein
MPSSPDSALAGRKILVVEDNFLIAEHLCSMLENQGCDVVGPVPRLAQALALVRSGEAIDGAVLDINLDGQLCFQAAAVLAERGVPFLFLTGYDDRAIVPGEFAARPVLSKPLDERRLIEMVAATFPLHAASEGP